MFLASNWKPFMSKDPDLDRCTTHGVIQFNRQEGRGGEFILSTFQALPKNEKSK